MSGREWQPGTVAMLRLTWSAEERRALRVGNIGWHLRPCSDAEEESGAAFILDSAFEVEDIRPLVVIDPEDREQVKRLLRGYSGWTQRGADDDIADYPQYVDDMQRALREFANPTPPRPEEPTGLGAVVEDAEGNRWIRQTQYVTSHRNDWHRAAGTSTGSDRRHWDGIAAVRVLSEGVTQ